MDVGRLCNLAYAVIVSEQGPDPAEARRKIDAALAAPKSNSRPTTPRTAGRAVGRAMSLAQARRVAQEVERQDAEATGRPVRGK